MSSTITIDETTNAVEVTTAPQVVEVVADTGQTVEIVTETTPYREIPRAVTIGNPQSGENITLLYTQRAMVVTQIVSQVSGSGGPSVVFSLRYAADRTAGGTEVVTGGVTCASTTTGTVTTALDAPTIPAGNWFWLTTGAIAGSVTQLSVTAHFA